MLKVSLNSNQPAEGTRLLLPNGCMLVYVSMLEIVWYAASLILQSLFRPSVQEQSCVQCLFGPDNEICGCFAWAVHCHGSLWTTCQCFTQTNVKNVEVRAKQNWLVMNSLSMLPKDETQYFPMRLLSIHFFKINRLNRQSKLLSLSASF